MNYKEIMNVTTCNAQKDKTPIISSKDSFLVAWGGIHQGQVRLTLALDCLTTYAFSQSSYFPIWL